MDVEILARGANRATVPARALLDSGADQTLLPLDFIEDFGISLEDMIPTPGQGASGPAQFQSWDSGARVRLLNIDFDLELSPALFGAVRIPVLGRDDFFAMFRCGFDQRSQRFWVEAY